MKHISISRLAALAAIVLSTSSLAPAALMVSNGSFTNLTGLGSHGGGWYYNVPTGWSGQANTYTVYEYSPGSFAANLSQLTTLSPFTPLMQAIGTVDATATVTLTFDTHILAGGGIQVGAAIYNAAVGSSPNDGWVPISVTNVFTTGAQSLDAVGVSAGTPLGIAFWSASGFPGIDNINIATTIPEPSSLAVLAAVSCFLVSHRRVDRLRRSGRSRDELHG